MRVISRKGDGGDYHHQVVFLKSGYRKVPDFFLCNFILNHLGEERVRRWKILFFLFWLLQVWCLHLDHFFMLPRIIKFQKEYKNGKGKR